MTTMARLRRIVALVLSMVVMTARADTLIKLEPYAGRLRQVTVSIAGNERKLLFDTGGGFTIISPSAALALGCLPHGRVYSLRMSGEKFVTQICAAVSYKIGTFAVNHDTVGVFDLMSLLPKDLPQLDGVISLKSFEGRAIALDLAANTLVVDARPHGRPFPCRIATGLDGSNLTLFAGVAHAGQSLWFEVDSGNLDDVRLAPHAAVLFGVGTETAKPITLALGPTPLPQVSARRVDIIYDGAFNAALLEQGVLFAELGLRPHCSWSAKTR